jgi:plastocyanin
MDLVDHAFVMPTAAGGTHPYRCSFHPQDMQGTVTVTS